MASQKRVHWAELRVGIMSALAMIIAGVLIFLLSGKGSLFSGEFNLRTYMEDSAGMAENAEVRLNGIYVGHIA
jgi:ABC-type transporter Mla subunit MlaD